MRYVIYGAGAVGGAVGALLDRAGAEVALIARGAHLRAMQERGITVHTPEGSFTRHPRVAAHPAELDLDPERDVVLLTVKSQHTVGALDDLRAAAGAAIPVVCAQNGIANEEEALRRFRRVYAMLVVTPASFVEPGEVVVHAPAPHAVLDLGRAPGGSDELAAAIAADIDAAQMACRADPEVMRLKRAKLLGNLGNAVQALAGSDADAPALYRALSHEARACFEASGQPYETWRGLQEARGHLVVHTDVPGHPYPGGSSAQSVLRGAGSIETDYLNGEIVLMGARLGIPVPYNRAVAELTADAMARGAAPGAVTLAAIVAAATALGGDPVPVD